MRIKVRLLIALLIALACATLGALAGSASASAATPQAPWTDSNAKGYIGFCDSANNQIYTGSINSYPFVAKAVSSTPAPTGYGAKVGRVTLYAYQPIQFVDPGNWSGKQLTGASVFSNTAVPMTIGLSGDASLVNFSAAYPLHWNGYAQLRMYYTAPGQQPYSSTYPAVAVQVTGTTWTQVGGGKVNCAAGEAESDEAAVKVANVPQHQGGQTAVSGTAAPTGGSAGSSGSSAGSTAGGASTSLSPVADTKANSSGGPGAGLTIGIAIVVVGVAAGIFVFLRRRRLADSVGGPE
jgi:hypothetical protein